MGLGHWAWSLTTITPTGPQSINHEQSTNHNNQQVTAINNQWMNNQCNVINNGCEYQSTINQQSPTITMYEQLTTGPGSTHQSPTPPITWVQQGQNLPNCPPPIDTINQPTNNQQSTTKSIKINQVNVQSINQSMVNNNHQSNVNHQQSINTNNNN